MGIKTQNSSILILELQIRDGIDRTLSSIASSPSLIIHTIYAAFEVGEITGTLKNIVSVAKHKVPSLLSSLNIKVGMKKGVSPPALEVALWIDNPPYLYVQCTVIFALVSVCEFVCMAS